MRERCHGLTSAPVRFALALTLAVLPLAFTACGSSAPVADALTGKSAATILRLALRNATSRAAVRYDITFKGSGAQQSAVGDARVSGGDVVVTNADGVVRIIVTGGVGYINAGAAGLQGALGLSPAVANTSANRWISVTSAAPQFKQLMAATSLSSILAEFTPGGDHLRLTEKTVSGHRVGLIDGIGTTPAKATYDIQLAVSTQTPVLPVGAAVDVQVNGQPATQVALFSLWGRHIPIPPPAKATPLSTTSSG